MDIQIQEAQKTPTRMNSKRPTPRFTVIILSKAKERILKAADVSVTSYEYMGVPIKLSEYFLAEIIQARKERDDIFNVLKE